MRAWQPDLRSPSTPICHCLRASGIFEAVSHEHIPNGARALGAPFLPRLIYGPCQSSRLNCRDNWSMQQRAQQSISTGWESPRNLSRASSQWHLCRGRRRNKGKRWRQSEQGVDNPPRISQNYKAMEVKQDDRHIFWVFSKWGGPASKPQITVPHTAEQGFPVWAVFRNCFPIG